MRPVNLLPEHVRAQAPAAVRGSSNVLLGVLAILLVAVLAFVLTSNQVNSRTAEIAAAEAEATQAETRAAAFAPFQQFAQIKTARLESVRALAGARFDWERLMRELALVLPSGTSLTAATASSGELAADGSTPAPAPGAAPAPVPAPPPGGAVATTPGVPTLALTGCATSQRRVAVMLVRLRQMHRAADVQLIDSSQPETTGGSTSSSAPTAGTCFESDYVFNVSVTFAPAPSVEEGDGDGSVPSRLGGGA